MKYVVCVTTAPCGAAAAALLKADKISHQPVSEEVDVKSVLAKVESGEADAGMVYQTDVTAGRRQGDRDRRARPAADSPKPVLLSWRSTKNVKEEGLAKDWIELMLSSDGQKVLTRRRFSAARDPPPRAGGRCRCDCCSPQWSQRFSSCCPLVGTPRPNTPWSPLPLPSSPLRRHGTPCGSRWFTAAVATVLCVRLALPLAWVLARLRVSGAAPAARLGDVPWCCHRSSPVSRCWSALGRPGLVGAPRSPRRPGCRSRLRPAGSCWRQTFVAMPFFVVSAEGALRATPTAARGRRRRRSAPRAGPRSAG